MGEYNFADNLVTLSRFRTSTNAAMVLEQLKSGGIDAHLEGEGSHPRPRQDHVNHGLAG